MNLENRYVHLDGLMWFPLDGGASYIVRSIEEDKFFKMQQDGKRIYELMDGSRSVNEIVRIVCEEKNLLTETASEEIVQFFEQLLKLGLITPVETMERD